MPRYSHHPERFPGSIEPPFYPAYVYDGLGREIKWCNMIDTDTGEASRQIENSAGELMIDNETGDLETITDLHPLPITLRKSRETETVPLIVEIK